METVYYKVLSLLLFIPTIVLGNNILDADGKYTEKKAIKKEFTVSADALLEIDNSYGNIDITSWNENRVIVEVAIRVNGNDQDTVIEKLKSIDVDFKSSPGIVSARTIFDSNQQSWWEKIKNSWNSSNLKTEINYTIKVPVTNSVNLNNDYGAITLDKIQGDAKINCDYGQVNLGELLGDNNSIHIDYSNNSSIKYMKRGKISADYSDFTIQNCGELQLNADYTKSRVDKADELNFNCDYGALKIGSIGTLNGNGDYVGIDVESVGSALNVISDYGSINVESLKSSTNEVAIKTRYTGVSIGYEAKLDFDFRIKTSYGSIKMTDGDVVILKKNQENTSKEYQGYRGVENSGNTINISTSYGGVKLNLN